MRRFFALLLSCLLVDGAAANPLAYVLASQESAPEISDPAASSARESSGEPGSEGELDAADIGKLAGRLETIALGYETFRAHLDANTAALVEYTAPQGLIQNPADRAQTLDRVYRALAVLDYTRALRYAEGETCARGQRRALLRSSDGLFADPKTGELSPWLKAELKRARAGESSTGLVSASAREWTPLSYLKTLAEARAASRLLADEKTLGVERAKAYCARGALYEQLASAQSSVKWSEPELPAAAVIDVRWGETRGTGLALIHEGKPIVLVSGKLTENEYETPDLFAKSGRSISASYLRRGPVFSVLSVQPAPDLVPLALPEKSNVSEQVAYSIGHPIQGGPWSVTRGLSRSENGRLRADAAIDEAQAGAPLFDAAGQLIGVVAGRGEAFEIGSVRRWLDDPRQELSTKVDTSSEEMGTGALLTASATFAPKETGGIVETGSYFNTNPSGKCVDVRGCGPPPSSSAGPSYTPSAPNPYAGCPPTQCYPVFMAPVMGFFGLIGKLLKSPPKRQAYVPDNRRQSAPVQSAPPVVPRQPEPPRDPVRPSSIALRVSKSSLALGETIEAVAEVGFAGKDGSPVGKLVSFSVVPVGLLDCPSARTDSAGIARVTCRTIRQPSDTPFDQLQDETRRRLGLKTPVRIRAKPAKADKNSEVERRAFDQDTALDREAEKHPEAGNDTPGLDKEFPDSEPVEVVVEGDRVTLGASIGGLNDSKELIVTDSACPDGYEPQAATMENPSGTPGQGGGGLPEQESLALARLCAEAEAESKKCRQNVDSCRSRIYSERNVREDDCNRIGYGEGGNTGSPGQLSPPSPSKRSRPQKMRCVQSKDAGTKEKKDFANKSEQSGKDEPEPVGGEAGKPVKPNDERMLGENGVQVTSKTLWRGVGKERIDVENPNPGKRPGQIHYQDNDGNKFLYDPAKGNFPNAPNSVNNKLSEPGFGRAIQRALRDYLGVR